MIVARTWQFLLLVEIVVIKLVVSSVTYHLLAHGKVNSSRPKSRRFFIGAWARRGNLLRSLVVQFVDMDLLHVATAQAHAPAFSLGDFWAEGAWLRLVAQGRWQDSVLHTRVVVPETRVMRAKAKASGIREVLRLVKFTRLVENRVRDVLCVLLQLWEAT